MAPSTQTEKATMKSKNGKAADPMSAALSKAAEGRRDEFQTLLKDFVEIPSVSMDPARRADMQRMAEAARALLERFGFEAKLLPTNGQPLVLGKKIVDPNAPTVTIYNHMDVQPGGERDE